MPTSRGLRVHPLLLLLLAPLPAPAACDPPRCLDVRVPVPRRLRVPEATVRVLLPAGYDGSRARYPVLYLLHGAGDRFTAWTERTDVEAFSAQLWEGTHEYEYIARATTPGTFIRPPAHAEEMYNPAVNGRSDGGTFVVRQRPR